MSLEEIAHAVVEFVRAHEGWELPIVAALAFGESLAVISLFLPATVALVGIGALIGASKINFVPVWLAASIGAALGDWLSYWFGVKFKDIGRRGCGRCRAIPTSSRKGRRSCADGASARCSSAVFWAGTGRGAARRGILVMPYWPFQLANVTSAFCGPRLLLAPGTVALRWLTGS